MDDEFICRIERQFWQNIPVRLLSWHGAQHALADVDAQDHLINLLGVADSGAQSVAKHVRASRAYSFRFLKELVGFLESSGIELSEKLYVILADLAASETNEFETVCHRCYFVPCASGMQHTSTDHIVLVEDVASISQGTTGLRTWQAALGLVEHLAANAALVQGRRILELGAGTGFVGLMCSRLGARRVYTTDLCPAVLSRLAANIRLNSTSPGPCKVTSFALDWEFTADRIAETLNREASEGFDTVLAADVIYSPDLVQPLASTISRLLHASKSDHSDCWIAATLRHEQTLSLFRESVAREGLVIASTYNAKDAVSQQTWYHYEEGQESVVLMQIRLE